MLNFRNVNCSASVEETVEIALATGNIFLENSAPDEIILSTSTGNIKGSLLSEKRFSAHSDTGRINVPQTIAGGDCDLRTDTGNIDITMK